MYLLVDSGSTKADWVLFDKHQADFFTTEGINPSTQNTITIQNYISKLLNQINHQPKKIFFYGAGSNSETAKKQLVSIFKIYFPDSELSTYSDLLAAGRALCKGTEAIVCILGTGSHAALCDGHEIIHQLPALGYILGDEGSGNHLGKEILKTYFYEKMQEELKYTFENKYPEVLTDFIYRLYQTQNRSSVLAKYGQFVVENKSNPICDQIIQDCFSGFINAKLKVYNDKSQLPVHLCGSIGFFLKKEFELCLQCFGFTLGNCVQKPIHLLLEYHRKELEIRST